MSKYHLFPRLSRGTDQSAGTSSQFKTIHIERLVKKVLNNVNKKFFQIYINDFLTELLENNIQFFSLPLGKKDNL